MAHDRTLHFLQAVDLLLEFTDEVPGSALNMPDGGPPLWLHTERNIRDWLLEMKDRIGSGRVHEGADLTLVEER